MNELVKWGVKKAIKSIAKKELREVDENIDEAFRWAGVNPFDAKHLNEGEDERIKEWKKSGKQSEPYYKKQLRDLPKERQSLINAIPVRKKRRPQID